MSNAFFKIPTPINEPVLAYAPGCVQRAKTLETYRELLNNPTDVPLYIGTQKISTQDLKEIRPPHNHKKVVGHYALANQEHVNLAIDKALEARVEWAQMPWQQRTSIFLKAADLVSGPFRARINAATMLNQSKNIHQAEIDAACEWIDFLRFNVHYLHEIYADQPISSNGVWNRVEYRPLEGFVYAVTPFNFTAIAGNLCASVALMGNVVVWKPSDHQVLSAHVLMEVFEAAGLPPGVINMITGDPVLITDIVLSHKAFAGIHYTGSTAVFQHLWKKIGDNIQQYNTYPRIVGETGGKDFIIAHSSAHPKVVATAIARGAFEFQGQKCSAASRVYLPKSIAENVLTMLKKDIEAMKMGSPENCENFVTAVIHEASFDKLVHYIEKAKASDEVKVIAGGSYDKSEGYFIAPTVLLTTNPHYETMEQELFGPVVTVYVYEDTQWFETLKLVDQTSIYALTGAVIAQSRKAIEEASKALENSAGNFYINDKPTGAVVGQQPFGGARASGTNDKAGSKLNLLRWVSPRLIKETLNPPQDFRYPFMG